MTFLNYCVDVNGNERVCVYERDAASLQVFESLIIASGFTIRERTFGTNTLWLIENKDGKEVTVQMLASRQAYVQAIEDRVVGPSTQTTELPALLATPKIDMLVVNGKQCLGDFPPLALRSCEIYFSEAPLDNFQLDMIHKRFSRTEQRFGT